MSAAGSQDLGGTTHDLDAQGSHAFATTPTTPAFHIMHSRLQGAVSRWCLTPWDSTALYPDNTPGPLAVCRFTVGRRRALMSPEGCCIMCAPLVAEIPGDHITKSVASLKTPASITPAPCEVRMARGQRGRPARPSVLCSLLPAGSHQVWTRPRPHVHCTKARKGLNFGEHILSWRVCRGGVWQRG